MKIEIPELCLVALIGASGAGKSSFATRHFIPTEIVSSDECRALVSDDESSLDATDDAFALLHFITEKRLKRGHLTVVDATNVQLEARAPLVRMAKSQHVFAVAIVFDLPEKICQERNASRPNRQFGPHVVRNHTRQLRESLRRLEKEGFRYVYVLRSPEEVDAVELTRIPLWSHRKHELGPFDIIGDVHGCADELAELLGNLGYARDESGTFQHPEGRRAVFVGDLADRGPKVAEVFRIVMDMTEAGTAFAVPGNHDDKLSRYFAGRKVNVTHGLQSSLDSLAKEDEAFRGRVQVWLDKLVSHLVLDGGKLVVAHAGVKAGMQGRSSGAVRSFCLYGETTGETDEFGLPERVEWAREYRGKASVVFGHTPVAEAHWLNNTINIDTGCVFGNKLTALRWPERELVSVPARETYTEPNRPFRDADGPTPQQLQDDVLDVADLIGKRLVETKLAGNVTVRAENAAAALEVMSRFAADPRWLIYLPPTMSPSATTALPGLLEHPEGAFDYFRQNGVLHVICEEKHMGSRAVVVLCKDEKVARRRFGAEEGESGIIYTRTGRRFFNDISLENELLGRLRQAVGHAGLWEELSTDWLCLDCELMPWSAKAQELLREQYAPVGAAGRAGLAAANAALFQAASHGLDVAELQSRFADRSEMVEGYIRAYSQYCWPVESVADLKLAPFHLLASEGAVHADKPHTWHMETLAKLALYEPVCIATACLNVDLQDEASCAAGIRWWEELTGRGGEGMVVKPLQFVTAGAVKSVGGLVQPAVKVRGREYLRIIYGPEYTVPENLERLRSRGLAAKRSLALREFALGLEGLERFVRQEPLRRVHECAFAVLALESEPVDPRL